jgi:hypothetical protein
MQVLHLHRHADTGDGMHMIVHELLDDGGILVGHETAADLGHGV